MTGGAPQGWRRVVATIAIGGLAATPLGVARMILPLIAASLALPALWIGLMGSVFTLVPMLGSVGFGRWIDRSGALVPMLAACLLTLAGSLAFALPPAFPVLVVVAGLFGAGSVFGHIAATRAVAELGEGPLRARNLGYLTAAYAIMHFVLPLLFGTIYDHAGPRGALLAMGGLALLTLLLLGATRHNYHRIRRAAAAPAASKGRAADLLRRPELRRWAVLNGICNSALTFLPFIVTLHVVQIGATASVAGLLLGAFGLGTVVSRLGMPLLYGRVAGPVILCLSLTAGALCYVVLPQLDSIPLLIALNAAMGLALGFGVPVALTLIYNVAPPDRVNEAMGISTALTTLMQTVTPLSLGLVSAGTGLGPLVWLTAAVMAAGGFYALAGRQR